MSSRFRRRARRAFDVAPPDPLQRPLVLHVGPPSLPRRRTGLTRVVTGIAGALVVTGALTLGSAAGALAGWVVLDPGHAASPPVGSSASGPVSTEPSTTQPPPSRSSTVEPFAGEKNASTTSGRSGATDASGAGTSSLPDDLPGPGLSRGYRCDPDPA
ncbi:MAG TPA: hypothetical protein VHF92_02400 [Geodermatophilus sp.]|nr:hypothetical protein [Geodermatophilus sp.]